MGHDTVIGKKCLIASQTGIAGCVVIEDEVTLWGQVGTTNWNYHRFKSNCNGTNWSY